jgi:hypothetical protein
MSPQSSFLRWPYAINPSCTEGSQSLIRSRITYQTAQATGEGVLGRFVGGGRLSRRGHELAVEHLGDELIRRREDIVAIPATVHLRLQLGRAGAPARSTRKKQPCR